MSLLRSISYYPRSTEDSRELKEWTVDKKFCRRRETCHSDTTFVSGILSE